MFTHLSTPGRIAMTLRLLAALVLAAALAACGKSGPSTEKGAGQPLLVASEDVHTVRSNALASGPVVTGTIQPERRADLRAEVAATVLQVLRENGDAVRRGDLLARLDDTAIRDGLASAESASRAAAQAHEQAERQLERMQKLRASGMASAQALDDAEVRRNNALSDTEAAKTRVVSARQMLQRTEVRAPFDGVVSDRKVSAGDTAQVGKELLKVIDPSSMRFEGLVSADNIANVKAGQGVTFRVNGYPDQLFTGKVRRVNPAANPTTRQVEVLVDFTGPSQPRLAGLYAEGHVETDSSQALTIPATALVREGDKALAWRVKDGKLQRAAIDVGERDARTGEFVVKAGLAEGDQVIRYPNAMLKDGQAVQASGGPAAATKAASSAEPPKRN
jgi:RND family efflux transporter MFP subunit